MLNRILLPACLWVAAWMLVSPAFAQELSIATVESQPLLAQAKRIAQSLEFLGQPLSDEQAQELAAISAAANGDNVAKRIQALLDPLCLAAVQINAESRVKVQAGPAQPKIVEQGWTNFLVKVYNDAGITPALKVSSPNAAPLYFGSSGHPDPKLRVKPSDVPDRWMDVQMFDDRPMSKTLSGLSVEYRIVQIYSRDRGHREASVSFDVGQGTQDIGFRNALPILFSCTPAVQVRLEVLDDDGSPTTAWFTFRDEQGRVYPARTRRLEPDFFFHDQIYRSHDEMVSLPPGEYTVKYSRGPEYRILEKPITVPEAKSHVESFRLSRWIHLAKRNWFSGDHHIHAAGCSHYEAPTQGVGPDAMMRHILGEDLNVGCVLSWGPCWYHQKQFFDGKVHQLSTPDYLMRYDVEVSGFPSSHCGHLCLLRLTEDDYPGTTKIEEWPSWDLPVLKWGKSQGGVVGFSHSGWGLEVPATSLPTYDMPKFDGIGANEYVVDVVHDVCDFISAVDTPAIWELNVWYHTLNCGYTCRISGETDFPCIYGDRVGLGRIYVKLDEERLDYDNWVQGLKDGRSYCGDGLSHLFDFRINDLEVGHPGQDGRASVLTVDSGQKLKVQVNAAALLDEAPNDAIRNRPLSDKPYWHLERARVGDSNQVRVELIVNGEAVDSKQIVADGKIAELEFDYQPARSSWVALRIFPSCHTNPIFVEVDGKPIRASKRSAQWCIDAVETCWNAKQNQIRESERTDAKAAFDAATKAYQQILSEAYDDQLK